MPVSLQPKPAAAAVAPKDKTKNGHIDNGKISDTSASKCGAQHITSGVFIFKQYLVVVACLSILQFISRYIDLLGMVLFKDNKIISWL